MSNHAFSNNIDDDDVLLWGGKAIGAAIGKAQKPTLRMLEQGKIKSAEKRDGWWIAWRRRVRAEFGLTDARQHEDAAVGLNGGA